MAVTATQFKRPARVAAQKRTTYDVQFDSSYQSGGEPLSAKQLGLRRVDFAQCQMRVGPEAEEFVCEAWYQPQASGAGLIHLLNAKTGKEVESTKNMEKVNVRVVAFGV